MGYFIPSFFQKRILHYALSRIELLDPDDLDLANLDITWGRKSTIELRDIGLRLAVCLFRFQNIIIIIDKIAKTNSWYCRLTMRLIATLYITRITQIDRSHKRKGLIGTYHSPGRCI